MKDPFSWRRLVCRFLGHRPTGTTPPAASHDVCGRCGYGFER